MRLRLKSVASCYCIPDAIYPNTDDADEKKVCMSRKPRSVPAGDKSCAPLILSMKDMPDMRRRQVGKSYLIKNLQCNNIDTEMLNISYSYKPN